MAQLNGLIVSDDEEFVINIARRLRSGAVSARVIDENAAREGTVPDVVIVDIRSSHSAAMPAIEQLRARWPTAGIFTVAAAVDADLVIQSMRAGANEFFAWPPPADTFDDALRRTSARRAAAPSTSAQATTMVFFGAKGGAGTTTLAVNCAVEIARQKKRPTLIVDLKAGLGEVTLFLGVRSRYTMLDALDNMHRLDQEFMKELVVKHKSGLEILAGSDLFDRPGASDSGALEDVFRLLGRQYEYIIVDAGAQMNACAVATLYTADTIFLVANPDVPSVRNAQRLLDRIGQLGASGDRVRVLLNRAAEPYPIPPQQIESALGHPISQIFLSDYKTVSTALNSGVPLATAGNSELASQFDSFARRLLDPNAVEQPAAPVKRGPLPLGLQRLASMW
jgi:pilus assembly protein CpaE